MAYSFQSEVIQELGKEEKTIDKVKVRKVGAGGERGGKRHSEDDSQSTFTAVSRQGHSLPTCVTLKPDSIPEKEGPACLASE